MNEKLQYASMLEIPVSTCTVSVKPQKRKGLFKRKKQVNTEAVKEELIEKVNEEVETPLVTFPDTEAEEVAGLPIAIEENAESTVSIESKPKQKGKRIKVSVIGVQIAVIGLLIATIFLTNAIYPDSGVNVFLRGVFGVEEEQSVDTRTHTDFAPVISLNDGTVTLNDGIMTFSGKGSVYSACDGTVTSVEQDESGKYVMVITHGANFKSVIGGLEYAYAGAGDSIYYNIPVGYVTDGQTSMCFTSGDGSVISNYTIIDNQVVWAV